MIELYHGSNMEIDKIDLKKGRRGKDFGQGFYLSEDKEQSLKMAQTAVDREESGTPIVTTYLFDENLFRTTNILNIKICKGYTKEWAQFVFLNRANKTEKPVCKSKNLVWALDNLDWHKGFYSLSNRVAAPDEALELKAENGRFILVLPLNPELNLKFF